ncbi:MAG: alpha-amylase family glycosyl hydrolase, partial [candidate division KSB1 bacterium]|nr:alpha-amylase family glycosyl hydrolase [candidate division KSB1 bacterium]
MLRVNVVAMLLIFLVVLSGIPSVYSGIYWEPSNPVPEDTITIIITNCTQGGKLHWGVNGWKQPIQAYWPPGSTPFDIASIESPLSGPDANKICTIKIGPFTNPAQPVKKIDFVIHWNDGSWDNNFGRDYHITLLTGIYWLPTNPTPNDTILVIIDNCTQGGNLHWGVNAEGRKWTQPIPGYWPNGSLVADPTAIESPLQGPDVNGQCTIRLGPFNSGAQMVRSVDFVIHWNDESWDNNGKLDYHNFLNLTPGPLDPKVSINSPSDGAIVSGLISIDFSASDHIGVELWIDGSLRYVATSSPFRYDWDTEGVEYGSHLIVAKAFNEAQRVAFAWITVWVLPSFIIGDPPPGTAPGATDNGDGTVTFALLAPGKSFVTIIGDWNPNVEVMNRTEKGLWWKVVPIPQGTYHYQYAINGNQRLCDPYARDVEWKYQGNEDWNPLNAKAVLKVAQESYSWNDQNFQVPELQDLIIYEIQTGDFSPQANFNGLRARLDYLSELGINAIELMPNYEFPGGISWGYNPAFYFAPETAYGTPEEFKQLVDAAHQKGIAVFMDMVFNHTDATSPLYQLYGPDFDSSPWYHNVSNPWGFPDLDHYKPATEALIDTVLRFWMDEYHIDGFRFDYTQGYDESSNAGRVNRIGRMTSKAKSHKSNIYLIAEHLPQETNIVTQTEMNSCWHDTFHDQMKANLREGTFEGRYWGDMHTTAQAIHYSGD